MRERLLILNLNFKNLIRIKIMKMKRIKRKGMKKKLKKRRRLRKKNRIMMTWKENMIVKNMKKWMRQKTTMIKN